MTGLRESHHEQLSIVPRAFEHDDLPSTPQLNRIMDRAMEKVKSMIQELESDKGKRPQGLAL